MCHDVVGVLITGGGGGGGGGGSGRGYGGRDSAMDRSMDRGSMDRGRRSPMRGGHDSGEITSVFVRNVSLYQ